MLVFVCLFAVVAFLLFGLVWYICLFLCICFASAFLNTLSFCIFSQKSDHQMPLSMATVIDEIYNKTRPLVTSHHPTASGILRP